MNLNPIVIKLAAALGLWPMATGPELRAELIRRGLLGPDPPLTPTFSKADLPLDRYGVLSALEDIRATNPSARVDRYPNCV